MQTTKSSSNHRNKRSAKCSSHIRYSSHTIIQPSQVNQSNSQPNGKSASSSQTQQSNTDVPESHVGHLSGYSHLSYRQKRRLQEAQRNGPKRGVTRGLKYISRKEREKATQEKPYANITDQMRRVVGTNASCFICECSLWVKEFCPLTSWNWCQMNGVAKRRLYEKIKANWDLPLRVDGKDVIFALKTQCARLYRGWRYRLKEKWFRGYTKRQAEANRPADIPEDAWKWLVYEFWSHPKQQRISISNSKNRLKQKIKPANGALSTARYIHDMMNAPKPTTDQPALSNETTEEIDGPAESEHSSPAADEPIYVRLYERTKKHKDGSWDPDALAKYNELKELHAEEVDKHGEDNLSVTDAYTKVLKEGQGYIRGLGYGPRPMKKARTDEENSELRERLTSEIEQLQEAQNAFSQREAALCSELQSLKTTNEQLKTSNEELRAANEELKASNEQLKASQEEIISSNRQLKLSNEQLHGEISRVQADAIKREEKFREEVMAMFRAQNR